MSEKYMHQFIAEDLAKPINIGDKFKEGNRKITVTGFKIYSNGIVDVSYTDKNKTPYGAELNWFLNNFEVIKNE